MPGGAEGQPVMEALALLQSELPGLVRFFIGLGLVVFVTGGSVLFTYWLSKGG
jgi:hypothetical protein